MSHKKTKFYYNELSVKTIYIFKMKKYFIVLISVVALFTSCNRDRSKPNLQYMPDMYVAVPYEPYSINPKMPDGLSSLVPPTGAVARGHSVMEYPGTNDGYNMALTNLKNPLPVNEENLTNGKKMYDINCAVCHGDNGDGKGILVTNGKYLGVPNFKDRNITEGSIYHVIYYGRNMMGSHAGQLTEKERWQVTQYVEKLRNGLLTATTNTTAVK